MTVKHISSHTMGRQSRLHGSPIGFVSGTTAPVLHALTEYDHLLLQVCLSYLLKAADLSNVPRTYILIDYVLD